jgi:hypothetical protein
MNTWGGSSNVRRQDEKRAKRLIRMWGYLTVGAAFLLYVASALHVRLF